MKEKKMKRKWFGFLLIGVLMLGSTACSVPESVVTAAAATPEPIYVVVTSEADAAGTDNVSSSNTTSAEGSVAVAYTETDESTGETAEVIKINLSDYAANSVVTIDTAGEYELSGTLTGQILVNVGDADKVKLVLNNAQITNNSGSAILVQNAEKVIITLNDGTQNSVTDGASYTGLDESGDPNAAIFSHDDLTINGNGSLTVTAKYADAIQSRDDLKISGGNISITAVDDGLFGNNSFEMKDATITVTAGGDTIHSDGDILIESGTLTLNSGDDGIHADGTITVNDGTINVQTCYEGLEASNIIVNGGVIDILSNDDGINAAGGNDGSGGNPAGGNGFAQDTFTGGQYAIAINGGTITIAAGLTGAGDGLDSNGTITVTGGDTVIKTPASFRDYTDIDSNSGFTMSGGSVRILNVDGTYTEVTNDYVEANPMGGPGGGIPGGGGGGHGGPGSRP
jgi:hypothetical protein